VLTPQLTVSTLIEDVSAGDDQVAVDNFVYQFVVIGPPNVSVPLMLFPNASVGVNGGGLQNFFEDSSFHERATAQVSLETDIGSETSANIDLGTASADITYSPDSGPTFTESNTFTSPVFETVTSDLLQSITMTASSYVYFDLGEDEGLGAGSAQAIVDPYVAIDPSFPLADEFSLVFSPYIANAVAAPAAVPEPPTLVLMSSAVIALAIVKRRRRSRRAERLGRS
jgi:hypothetical protein